MTSSGEAVKKRQPPDTSLPASNFDGKHIADLNVMTLTEADDDEQALDTMINYYRRKGWVTGQKYNVNDPKHKISELIIEYLGTGKSIFSLVKKEKNSFLYENENGQNLLMFACMEGDRETATHLANIPLTDLNRQDKDGWTALHYAAYNKNIDLVEMLLRKQADPTRTTCEGYTAYELASHTSIREQFEKNSTFKFWAKRQHKNGLSDMPTPFEQLYKTVQNNDFQTDKLEKVLNLVKPDPTLIGTVFSICAKDAHTEAVDYMLRHCNNYLSADVYKDVIVSQSFVEKPQNAEILKKMIIRHPEHMRPDTARKAIHHGVPMNKNIRKILDTYLEAHGLTYKKPKKAYALAMAEYIASDNVIGFITGLAQPYKTTVSKKNLTLRERGFFPVPEYLSGHPKYNCDGSALSRIRRCRSVKIRDALVSRFYFPPGELDFPADPNVPDKPAPPPGRMVPF